MPTAWVLVLHYHSIYPDALSRTANAYYMLYSADPHAAAIGFVWNPFPSLSTLPFLLFKDLWPALSVDAFAANIVSCLCYGLACWQLYRFFEDLRINRVARWVLLFAFAANPMIFYYGVNGMSEMEFILTLIVLTRFLSRWLSGEGGTDDLVIAGAMLGVSYMVRNEAAAAAAAGILLVFGVSWLRASGRWRERRWPALTDAGIFVLPFVFCLTAWALTSYIIVGQFFPQFSSANGNSALIKQSGGTIIQATAAARAHYALEGAFTTAPLLTAGVAIAVVVAWRRRDWRLLAPIAAIVSVLAFEILAYTQHQLFPWYRYYIYACPAVVMIAAYLVRPGRLYHRSGNGRWWPVLVTTALAAGLVLPGLVTTTRTLGTEGGLAGSDRYEFAFILWPHAKDASTDIPVEYQQIADLARQLDALHLPKQGLMLDNATTCVPQLILSSRRPTQFAIPNDENYEEKFGVPYQFGVRYFLAADPVSQPADQLNVHLPSLYADGQGLATLVRQIDIPGCPRFRLYKLIPQQG